jgi:hypothetical protein
MLLSAQSQTPHKVSKVGRPLKFKNPKELQKAIDAYFARCSRENEPLTITGLALALDTTRETLMDYENRDEFSDTIKKAKLRIEQAYEFRNIKRGNAGDIFALKQIGWKDKTEITGAVAHAHFDVLGFILNPRVGLIRLLNKWLIL